MVREKADKAEEVYPYMKQCEKCKALRRTDAECIFCERDALREKVLAVTASRDWYKHEYELARTHLLERQQGDIVYVRRAKVARAEIEKLREDLIKEQLRTGDWVALCQKYEKALKEIEDFYFKHARFAGEDIAEMVAIATKALENEK